MFNSPMIQYNQTSWVQDPNLNFVLIQKNVYYFDTRSYSAVAQSDRSGHEDKGGAKALTAKRHIWQDWQRHNWDCYGNQDTLYFFLVMKMI